MADYKDIFRTEESQNWYKCALAIHITREGILDFVENEINQFHQYVLSILPSGSICNTCTTQNVVPCPATGVCKKGRGGQCLNFHSVSPTGCPKKICDRIVREIDLVHRHKRPSWQNTDASKWFTNHWEVAKCFCPPDGYKQISSAKETDFNGLLSIIQNCTRFGSLLSPSGETVVEKARDVGRNIKHSPDLKINSQTTSGHIDALIALLNDGQCLSQMPKAADGRLQLDKLRNDIFTITNQDIRMIVAEAYEETIRDKLNSKTSNLDKRIDSLQEIKYQIESRVTCLQVASDNQERRVTDVENTLLDQCQRIFQLKLVANQDNYQVLKEGHC